jgi:hypothetical protein
VFPAGRAGAISLTLRAERGLPLLGEETSVAELVDGLVRHPDDVQVDDRAAAGTLDDVDDASEERLVGVPGDDQCAVPDTIGFCRCVEKRPDVARVIAAGRRRGG